MLFQPTPINLADPESSWQQFQVDLPEMASGKWRVSHFTVTPMDPERWHHKLKGRDTGIGDFTKLSRYDTAVDAHEQEYGIPAGTSMWVPVMSDTRCEIIEHWPIIERLFQPDCKRVLIGALGLGMITRAALLSPFVEHIDVVDLSPDVISMVAPHLDDPRLTIHEGDIFTWEPPGGLDTAYDVGWYDPWDNISSDNLPAMGALHRRFNARWSGCWSEPEARASAERELRFEEGTLTLTDLVYFMFDGQDVIGDEEQLIQLPMIRELWENWQDNLKSGHHARTMEAMRAEKEKNGTLTARSLLEACP